MSALTTNKDVDADIVEEDDGDLKCLVCLRSLTYIKLVVEVVLLLDC